MPAVGGVSAKNLELFSFPAIVGYINRNNGIFFVSVHINIIQPKFNTHVFIWYFTLQSISISDILV